MACVSDIRHYSRFKFVRDWQQLFSTPCWTTVVLFRCVNTGRACLGPCPLPCNSQDMSGLRNPERCIAICLHHLTYLPQHWVLLWEFCWTYLLISMFSPQQIYCLEIFIGLENPHLDFGPSRIFSPITSCIWSASSSEPLTMDVASSTTTWNKNLRGSSIIVLAIIATHNNKIIPMLWCWVQLV